MAQGEYKKRSDKFATQRKSKSSKKSKSLGPRKGGMHCHMTVSRLDSYLCVDQAI